MNKDTEDYAKFRDAIFSKWSLPDEKFKAFLNKQLDQFPAKLFEKHFLLDFLFEDLEAIKTEYVKKGGLKIKSKKEKIKPTPDLANYEFRFQIYFEWVVRKKIVVDKELFLGISMAMIELKEWIDPEYELNYLRNQITQITDDLENEKLADGPSNPLFEINNLFKKGEYPYLFESDINQVVNAEVWVAYRRFLKDRLRLLETQSLNDEIAVHATIKADQDKLGNITLNFPLGVLKDIAWEMVQKENDRPKIVTYDKLPVLLTRNETATLLRVSLQTLHIWTKEGRIQAERLGKKQIRYRKENVEKFIREIRTVKFHNN